MELLYLWIDSFSNIQDQEFCFTNDYKISFKKEKSELSLSEIENKTIKLFDESFLNVTLLIGKNGSGKTSFISFIKSIFADSTYYQNRFIALYKDENSEITVIDKFSSSKYKLNIIKNLKNDKISTVDNKINLINLVDLIINSNSFSIYERDFYGARYLDISLNKAFELRSIESNRNLLKRQKSLIEYFKDKTNQRNYKEAENRIIESTIPRKIVYKYDLLANVNFISKYKNNSWDFIPDDVDIQINGDFFYNNLDFFNKIGLTKVLPDFEYLIFSIQDNPNDLEKLKEKFKNSIIIYFFLYYIVHNQYRSPKDVEIKSVIKKIDSNSEINYVLCLIKSFMLESSGINKNKEVKIFIEHIDSQFDNFKEFHSRYLGSLTFPLNKEVCTTIQNVFEIWMDNDFIFLFSWHNLSAGESALLTLFSKIQSISDNNHTFKKTIWLMIDEGDLYLHPEWQRTFFSDLHKYLPMFFEGKKIQLFLTSHSPIVVSDLPRGNIIFLNKVDGLCKVLDKDKFKNTFGANIHTLFTDAFFMEGGLIGEFAKEKIFELLDEIEKSENISKANYDEFTKRINIIGEPLIKEKLVNLLDKKFLSNDLQKKREYHQSIINDIDEKLNNPEDEKGR